MKSKTVWNGTHRDITYEIQNFKIPTIDWGSFNEPERDCWAFYLYIRLNQIPEHIREKFWLNGYPISEGHRMITHYYYDEPLIADLDWHYGVTYYSKESGFDGEERMVKIGCDYQHYWDEGHAYNENMLEFDAKKCIDSLHEKVHGIMRACFWCGEFFTPNGEETRCTKCIEKVVS